MGLNLMPTISTRSLDSIVEPLLTSTKAGRTAIANGDDPVKIGRALSGWYDWDALDDTKVRVPGETFMDAISTIFWMPVDRTPDRLNLRLIPNLFNGSLRDAHEGAVHLVKGRDVLWSRGSIEQVGDADAMRNYVRVPKATPDDIRLVDEHLAQAEASFTRALER